MKKKQLLLLGLALGAIFTSCKKDEEKTPYDLASASNGGIMYDKFWAAESDFDQTNTYLATLNAKGDFFRCKQCHGWDLLGTGGSYINRGPKTSRPNVSGLNLYAYANGKTAQELFDGMKKTAGRRNITTDLSTYDPATAGTQTEGDKMPNYTELLTDAQIWDLVKFMKEGAFDVSQLYDATYTGTYPTGSASYANVGKGGNAANGNTLFTDNCATCHGSDGKLIPLEGLSVGKFVRSKAYEVQHKVKYGQLGSAMAGEFDWTHAQMTDIYKALSDETSFPD